MSLTWKARDFSYAKAEFCETYFLFLEITPLLDIRDYESFSSLGIRHSESDRPALGELGCKKSLVWECWAREDRA